MYHSSPHLITTRSPLFSVISFSPLLSRMKYGYTSNTVYFFPLSLKTCPVFISSAFLCRAVISSRYCPVIFDFKYISFLSLIYPLYYSISFIPLFPYVPTICYSCPCSFFIFFKFSILRTLKT